MKFSAAFITAALYVVSVSAHELPSRYAGQRRGNQFVTGPCQQDSDCQQGCCAFNTGKCAGPAVAQTRDGGCGHGSPAPNCNVAAALKLSDCAPGAVNGDLSSPAIQSAAAFVAKLDNIPFTPTAPAAAPPAPPASNNAGGGGTPTVAALAAGQSALGFVTSTCATDSDCQQGCCAFNTGKCAGPAIAQTRDGGCGHSSPAPNCNVAKALGLNECAAGAVNGNLQDPKIQAAAAFVSILDNIPFTPSAGSAAAAPPPAAAAPPASNNAAGGTKSVSALAASQSPLGFVTSTCATDSDCQQGCCAFNTGKCAGPAIAQTRDGGCGHSSPAPNCNVAKALGLNECAAGAVNGNLQDPKIQAAAAFVSILDNIPFTPA
ncbi:unnamed protein product [Mycena citricolor]|uniref:Biotrophy-associated secreted protein 2 n=1 Tax=Mycena citricolor TaxID=2018698 RepID=A0AAD2H368_9AGAR|nr:unnamed protein product [Mycena citricolor]